MAMMNFRGTGKGDILVGESSRMKKWCLTSEDSVLNERNLNVRSKKDLLIGNNCGDGCEVRYQKWCDRGIRHRVKATLEIFRETLRKHQQENKAKPRIERDCSYTFASNVLKRNGKWLNTKKRLGVVPGIEIGDEFLSKAELRIVGLHHRRFCGIDYFVQKGVMLATSVVATRRYANKMEASDVLLYVGEGGNPQVKNDRIKDQKLERGNLALKNSMDHNTPVRVIRCKDSHGQNGIAKSVYVYEGLYMVESYWQDRGEFGKLVFKFLLRKLPGQQKMSKNVTNALENIFKDNRKSPVHKKLAQDVKREPFLGFKSKTSGSCDCVNGCSASEDCSCKVKNGGKMPYDSTECLVRIRPWIYECGPSCKCSLSCINRVSRCGTRTKLELFKNEFSRYRVRSKSYIPKGSFICEYVARNGFLGKEKQEENIDVTMDGGKNANIERYINKSSSPNLYCQKIIISLEDEPHLMLFTMRDMSPYEELTIGFKNQVLNSSK